MLDWGTRKRRIGAASVKDFDACGVCLSQAVEPLVCPKGHVFCKACIYECLLAQKQFIKKQQEKYAKQEEDAEKDVKEQEVEKQIQTVEKFEKQENAVLVRTPAVFDKKTKRIAEPHKNAPFTPGVSTKLVVVSDKDKKKPKKDEEVDEEAKMRELPCYWIPNLTPEQGKEVKVSAPNTFTVCPTGHPCRMKQLCPVNFSLRVDKDKEKAVTSTVKSGRYRCYSCSKDLTNTIKTACLRKCGHVMCQACATTIVKVDGSCTCGKVNKSKDVVELELGGTGFASTGSFTAETKATPAFTCS